MLSISIALSAEIWWEVNEFNSSKIREFLNKNMMRARPKPEGTGQYKLMEVIAAGGLKLISTWQVQVETSLLKKMVINVKNEKMLH